MHRLLRLSLILLVALSVVAPKLTAVAAGLLPAGGRVVVICTGTGLQRITLGPDGAPVKGSPLPDHCALIHAADTAAPLPGPPRDLALALPQALRPAQAVALAPRPTRRHTPRAPPSA